MTQSGARILMPATDADWFVDGIRKVVQDNIEFVPPYGSGGAMYIRPLLFGSGPRIGLQPSDEYTLLIMVMPVADYYKGGMKPTTAVVVEGYDRAAPRGVGNVKVAGNYAADLLPNTQAKHDGYPIALYLDAKTNTLVEEFSTSNFFAITKDGSAFVTPSSPTILPSITNKSLQQLAEDMGLRVEKRQVPISEVQSGAFGEVAACGTAVVLTGIKRIVCGGEVTDINGGSDEVGPVLQKLYDTLRGIQNGEIEDKHGWMTSL
jgi:branched-chain amino acid aminotransferase